MAERSPINDCPSSAYLENSRKQRLELTQSLNAIFQFHDDEISDHDREISENNDEMIRIDDDHDLPRPYDNYYLRKRSEGTGNDVCSDHK